MKANKIKRAETYIEQLQEIQPSSSKIDWPIPTIPSPTGVDSSYLPKILNARVYDVCKETPLTYARKVVYTNKLSAQLKNTIYFKREDQQPIFSFKCRGAFNRIFHLSKTEKERGVCCVSAGNHAQGVALACSSLKIKARIVMPLFAPEIKVENVVRLGADVILHGNNFDEAKKECLRIVNDEGYVFVPPFDDPLVIAGQGTVGMEILSQIRHTRLDAVFICCGGGGLLAGIGTFIKSVRPDVKIIGVNTIDSDSMYQSLLKGEQVELESAGLFSDGTSIRTIGKECLRLCKGCVDDFVRVSNDEICAAIKICFDETRSILEPSGALAIAGAKKYLSENRIEGGVFVCIASGANMNFDRLQFVTERSAIGEGKESLFSVLIPEKAGSLKILLDILYASTITEVSYRYSNKSNAHVFVAFDSKTKEDRFKFQERMRMSEGFEALDITDNELAASHVRFMSGGRSTTVSKEILIRLRLPETPRSVNGLLKLVCDWNITLFHYRNHGADYGRVLIGLEDTGDVIKLISEFRVHGYRNICDESQNEVYKHFMQ